MLNDPAPLLAASVILLRDSPVGLEVFVQHRALTMDFAAGVIAFPGGRIEKIDSHEEIGSDLLRNHAASWIRTSVARDFSTAGLGAGRLMAAAVREVAEECGILLEPRSLRPWANWITPEGMPKRFDTYFFVCAVPSDVAPQHITTEASHSLWLTVHELIQQEAAGTLRILPPTLTILDELLELGAVDRVLRRRRMINPVCLRPDRIEEFYRSRQESRTIQNPEN